MGPEHEQPIDREGETQAGGAQRGLSGVPSLPRTFGPYVVERALAQGGMGAVYVGRHAQLGRRVAIKVMLGTDPRRRRRFAIEALATAKLRHPNIVPIHETGQEGQTPYLIMDLVEGEALSERIQREGPLDPRVAAQLTRTLAGAVQAAHDASILHRDLKPANVLINQDGEPLITDFGLAKDVSDAESLTKTGQALGTLAYMPPEQATGNRGAIGPRSDVYSLGATLYEMLSGRPPFGGEQAMNLIVAVVTDEPVPLRQLRPSVEPELEAICLKCLAKAPEARYDSAHAFGEDLGRWLNGEPTLARPRSRGLRLAVGGLVAVGLGLAALAIAAFAPASATNVDGVSTSSPAPRPTEEPPPDEPALTARQIQAGERRLSSIRMLPAERRVAAAAEWLEKYPGHPLTEDLYAQRAEAYLEVPVHVFRYRDCVGAAFLPDGESALTWGRDTTVGTLVWDLETGLQTRRWDFTVQRLAVAASGLLYGTAGENVYVTRLSEDWAPIHTAPRFVDVLRVSPSGSRLAVASRGLVEVLDLERKTVIARLEGFDGTLSCVDFYDDELLVVGSGGALDQAGEKDVENALRVWDLSAPSKPLAVMPLMARPQSVSFSPTERKFVSGCNGENILLYDAGGEQRGVRFIAADLPGARGAAHKGVVRGVAYGPRGLRVVSTCGNTVGPQRNEIRLWEAATQKGLWLAPDRPFRYRGVQFDPSGTRVLATSVRQVEYWDLSALSD